MSTKVATRRTETKPVLTPPVDIYDAGDKVVMVADMPGVSAEHLDVNFDRGRLVIHGQVDMPDEGTSYGLQEFRRGDFHREITLGDEIDPQAISAELKNGVLTLNLGKVKEQAPVKIKVKAK